MDGVLIPWVVLGGLVAGWSALLLGIIRWFLIRDRQHIDNKFTDLGNKLQDQTAEVTRIDREILILRAELPNQYVRREDAIRNETVVTAKLDSLGSKIEQLMLMRGSHDGH